MNHSREQALELLHEWTKSESLRNHAYGVEAALRFYANKFEGDEELWGITGLLHDFDYERHPEPKPDGHPFVGCEKLRELGYPDEMVEAILGHATYSGVARETLLAKALFACDELSGLVTAAVLVRPDKSIESLSVKSVKKKMKDKAFARGVNRDDIFVGTEELGLSLEEHIQNVIDGMKVIAREIGLAGEPQ